MKKSLFEDVFIFLQILLIFVLIILLVMSLFIGELMMVIHIVLALLLFVIGINNHIRFRRKFLTPLYFIFGCLVLGLLFI